MDHSSYPEPELEYCTIRKYTFGPYALVGIGSAMYSKTPD